MDRSSHAGAEVGRARGEVTPLGGNHEIALSMFEEGMTQGGQTAKQTVINSTNVAA